jgi:hypothetical protein
MRYDTAIDDISMVTKVGITSLNYVGQYIWKARTYLKREFQYCCVSVMFLVEDTADERNSFNPCILNRLNNLTVMF